MEMLVGYLAGRRDRLPDPLRLVLMSGDWIPVSLPTRIRALAAADIDLISLGGATEASIWSIWHRITDVLSGWVSIPYGTPLANQQFDVLDDALRRRPDWVPGEQYVGGAGVAMGYWHDEAKTCRSFITHPRTGQRLYRTGDLGRYFPDGSIEFLGRDDFQVKILGYRIELGEIESTLLSHDQVRAAVVTAIGKARGEKRLVAYIVANAPVEPTGATTTADADVLVLAVREHLAAKLPAYMVPSYILVLDALPLTSNGKVDRTALPLPVTRRPTPKPAPSNPHEDSVLKVWRELLDAETIGPDDDWVALGATPAQIVEAHHRLRAALSPHPRLETMFTHRTARALAAVLQQPPA
jgi:pyochelin synthetase